MDLPSEILEIIFSYCSVTDLLQSVQFVCQKWHDLALSPGVWKNKTLQLSGNENLNELKSVLHQLPFLKNVCLEDAPCKKVLSLLCDSCSCLRNLQINYGDPHAVLSLCSNLISLTHIDICFQRSFKLEVAFGTSDINFPPMLRTVVFRMCTTDGDVPVCLFENCNYLEHVVVSLGPDLESFIKSSLEDNAPNSKRAPGNHNMHTVYLCGAILYNKDVLLALSKYPNIKCLAIKHNLFHNADVLGTIFKESCPELVFLDLSYSFNLTSNAVLSVLKACPNLVYLSLMRCFIGDEVLLGVINWLNQLQFLNLHGTLITSQYFSNIPQKLSNLTNLNLCACRTVNRRTLTELVNMMPNLLIVHPRSGLVRGSDATGRLNPFLNQRNAVGNN